MGLCKVTGEKTIGKFGTKEQTVGMSGCKIEKGVDSRNLRSKAKTDGGNPTLGLGAVPGQYRNWSYGISNVWKSQSFSDSS